jgi:hypothetical protein
MLNPALVCLSVLAILVAPVLMQAAAGQECTPEFAIYSAESVEGAPATFVRVDIAVKNAGSCAGMATVSAQYPENWLASTFTTGEIQPGETDTKHSIKVIMPSGAKSSVINFTAPGANATSTKIIIGGLPVEEKNETRQEQTQPAINPDVIKPEETPQQQAEPQAQNQPASPVTGLLTANPSFQIAVFAIMLFGAGYLVARIKSEGFRYRFRQK